MHSALTTEPLYNNRTVVAGGGWGGQPGRWTAVVRCPMSIEARLSAGVRGVHIQIATQSFEGNDAFRRSATAETSMFIVRVLPSNAVTYVTNDKQL